MEGPYYIVPGVIINLTAQSPIQVRYGVVVNLADFHYMTSAAPGSIPGIEVSFFFFFQTPKGNTFFATQAEKAKYCLLMLLKSPKKPRSEFHVLRHKLKER